MRLFENHSIDFCIISALCHTVLPEADTDSDQKIIPGSLKYQAQSPDEAALLTAARAFGFTFTARTPEEMEVCVKDEVEFYQLLAFVDFNNDRKRMSVCGCHHALKLEHTFSAFVIDSTITPLFNQ